MKSSLDETLFPLWTVRSTYDRSRGCCRKFKIEIFIWNHWILVNSPLSHFFAMSSHCFCLGIVGGHFSSISRLLVSYPSYLPIFRLSAHPSAIQRCPSLPAPLIAFYLRRLSLARARTWLTFMLLFFFFTNFAVFGSLRHPLFKNSTRHLDWFCRTPRSISTIYNAPLAATNCLKPVFGAREKIRLLCWK